MLDIRPLPENLQKIASEELNENPERLKKDLQKFREWIELQPHLRSRTNDQFLISFLRGCKYSIEKAKSKLDKYYLFRTKYSQLFAIHNMDEPKILELYKMGIGLSLPEPLYGNGPRLLYARVGQYSPNIYTFTDMVRMTSTLASLLFIIDDYIIMYGAIIIVDLTDFTVNHMLQITPMVIKLFIKYIHEAIPIRLQAVHFLNAPVGFDRLYNIMKSLLPMKQQSRFHVHGVSWETLFEYIPQRYLIKELGGTNSSIDECINWNCEIIEEYWNFLQDESKYGTDENLRLDKILDMDDMLGIEGTFRKLEVD